MHENKEDIMKNFLMTICTLFLVAGAVYAMGSAYMSLKYGTYTCPEGKTTCKIDKLKNGDLIFSEQCKEISEKMGSSKYAPMIKLGKCKYVPNTNKYYSCEYADARCTVILFSDNRTQTSCTTNMVNNVQITSEQRSKIYERVAADAKNGNCQELYVEEPQAKK